MNKISLSALRAFFRTEVHRDKEREDGQEEQRRKRVDGRMDATPRHRVNQDGQIVDAGARREKADDEIVHRKREGEERPRQDAGQDLRQYDAPESISRTRTEVEGRVV